MKIDTVQDLLNDIIEYWASFQKEEFPDGTYEVRAQLRIDSHTNEGEISVDKVKIKKLGPNLKLVE